MNQNGNLQNWIDFWKTGKGFFDQMSDLEQAETWNERWGKKGNERLKPTAPVTKQERMKTTFEMLDEAGFGLEGARILDIGCGPGATAIPFAKAGAKVTALDISGTALAQIKAEAEKDGLDIETIESSWWSADIDKLGLRNRFDLVFVTSTPAVKDADGFNRMIACSKNLCYYSFFLRHGGYMQSNYPEVYREIFNKELPEGGPAKGDMFMNAFMYVYLLGHHPRVRVSHHQRELVMDWAEAAERAIEAFERRDACPAENKETVREYYKTVAVDGKHHSRNEVFTGMMLWDVKSPS